MNAPSLDVALRRAAELAGILAEISSRGQEPQPVPHPNNGTSRDGGEAVSPYSPLELQILQALPYRSWATQKTVLAALRMRPDSDVPALMRNLVERGALESQPGIGYYRKARLPGDDSVADAHE